jgi:hypothetical protein
MLLLIAIAAAFVFVMLEYYRFFSRHRLVQGMCLFHMIGLQSNNKMLTMQNHKIQKELVTSLARNVELENLCKRKKHIKSPECVVCKEKVLERVKVANPCGHGHLCVGCFQKCNKTCPICKSTMDNLVTVYD